MANKRVTLKDIAEKTGFTINTVSHALKDMNDVSKKTKTLIRKAAKELNYVGDLTASALRSGKTHNLAVIVGDIANPFFGSLVKGLEIEAKKFGYSITIYNSGENSQWERNAILSAYSQRVDGIFICPVQENTENLTLLRTIEIPFVLIGRHFAGEAADAVVWDDRKGGEIATKRLIDSGHVNILYVGGEQQTSSAKERLQGYRDAYENASLKVNEALIQKVDTRVDNGYENIKGIVCSNIPFTAIVAFSDLIAYEILTIIYREQHRVFDNNALVGFDCIHRRLLLPFHFSSIDCIGDEPHICIELMLKLIRGDRQRTPELICLDVELVNSN